MDLFLAAINNMVAIDYNRHEKSSASLAFSFSFDCTGNMDRHHYETFEKFGNETFIIHLDNGRG